MQAATKPAIAASLPRVTNDEGARELEARRVALGITVTALADEAGVDRGRLAKVLKGEAQARAAYLSAIATTLHRLEEEAGMHAPAQNSGLVEFDITGDFGVHVVVKGPVGDADALQRQVIEIIREIRKGDTPNNQ